MHTVNGAALTPAALAADQAGKVNSVELIIYCITLHHRENAEFHRVTKLIFLTF